MSIKKITSILIIIAMTTFCLPLSYAADNFKELEKAAYGGDIKIQNDLGVAYDLAKGVEQDYALAFI